MRVYTPYLNRVGLYEEKTPIPVCYPIYSHNIIPYVRVHNPYDKCTVMENLPALQQSDIQLFITQAIDKGVPVETLERLLIMAKELKAEYAKEQFNINMSAFQANCPVIKKTKSVTTKSGMVAYRYAPIESIVQQVKHLIQEYGFSYSIDTETKEKTVKAICTVRHLLGHNETSSFEVPLGQQTQVMNDSQVVAAALTFAKRYAFCNAFGIMTSDQDTDGATAKVELITNDQLNIINIFLTEAGVKEAVILDKYKVASLNQLTAYQAKKVIDTLKAYIDNDDIPQ